MRIDRRKFLKLAGSVAVVASMGINLNATEPVSTFAAFGGEMDITGGVLTREVIEEANARLVKECARITNEESYFYVNPEKYKEMLKLLPELKGAVV